LVKQIRRICLGVTLSALFIACSHGNTSASAPTVESKTQELSQETKQTLVQATSNQQQSAVSQPAEKKESVPSPAKEEKQPPQAEMATPKKSNETVSAPAPAPVTPTQPQANKSMESEKTEPIQTVSLSIVGDKEHGVILSAQSVPIEQGDTVLDVLSRVVKGKKIQMEYSGVKATAYVKGIDNLYEFDDGPKSGWMVKVNGKTADRSAGNYPVKAGDTIEWLYTLDLGKDIGAK
jgi:hypothetical protein